MLRLIYKTILISIISSMLMVGDLISYADTQGALVRNADGSYSKTNTYDFKSTKSDDSAMAVVAMFAVGFLGTKLLMYKKWTMDMTVGAAASGIYLVGEAMNLLNAKKELDKISTAVTLKSDAGIDSKQVEYIKSLRGSYQKILEALKRKKTLQNIAMLGYLAAGGVAAVQYFRLQGKKDSCNAAIEQARVELNACDPTNATFCQDCNLSLGLLESGINAQAIKDNVPAPSVVKYSDGTVVDVTNAKLVNQFCAGEAAPIKATVTSACTAYLTDKETTKAFGAFTESVAFNYPDSLKQVLYPELYSFRNGGFYPRSEEKAGFLSRTIDLVFPRAHAGWMSLLGLAGGAAAAFFSAKTTIGKKIDTYMYTPGGRIIVWGVFAGITKIAIGVTEDKIKQTEDNINKIDKILNETSRLTKGVQASNANIKTVSLFNDDFLKHDTVLSTNDKTGCIETATNKCASTTAAVNSLTAVSELPAALQTVATQVTGTADSLSNTGTISGSTMSTAADIGKNSAAISKLLNQQKNAINALAKQKGRAEVNFGADENKLKGDIFGAANGVLNNKGGNGFLASIGSSLPGFSNGSASTTTDSAIKDVKKPNVKMTSGSGSIGKGEKAMDFKLNNESNAAPDMLANGMKEGSANDRYDMKETEVNKDSGVSIFDLISSRYIKSGYPKLLDVEESKK